MTFPPGTLVEHIGENKKKTKWTLTSFLKEFKLPNGELFSFKNYEFWEPIYEDKSPMQVIQSSRQIGKTTYVTGKMTFRAMEQGNRQILLAVPNKIHRDTIVGTLEKRIHNSPVIRSQIGVKENKKDKKKKDNLEIKQFKNNSEISIVIVKASPDVVRSKTSGFIFIDEAQLIIDKKNIHVLLEVSNTFPNPEIVFTGTPTTPGNNLNKLYLNGTKMEWIVPCAHCGKNRFPLGPLNLDEKVESVICRSCRRPLNVTKGFWEPQNPSALYSSWRISELMRPDIQFRTASGLGILDKMKSRAPDVFYNESLGLPAELGKTIISEAQLKNCCDPTISFIDSLDEEPHLRGLPIVMSIDWALEDKITPGATTISSVWVREPTDRLRCLWVTRFVGLVYYDPDVVLDEIISTAIKFGVNFIWTDHGMGHKENIRLRKRLREANIPVGEIQYPPGSSANLEYRSNNIYQISRTTSLSTTIIALKEKKFRFPSWEESEPYLHDVLNVYQEKLENKELKYSNSAPDDFFHCLNYTLHGLRKMMMWV